ncbi:RICIN domain-containing protein [Rugosimonospora africana]|uniref:Ricin B lectin domain-containing protein n=1 Tax=Rugosimonospora africana TaxID=556532 RepID=A0A8J3VTT0_9ACTN|nr:RICIN domain-containing protein [Rugosimonospora africana]GIH17863.1 hypothetical protein Raf01_60350 [Rugosimonospora africana]
MNGKLTKTNGRKGSGLLGRIGATRRIAFLAVAGLIAALAGLVVPLAAASPAQAGPPNYCSGGELGPYWFGAVGATNAAGHRKVIAISTPYSVGSYAYLWDDNKDARQQFCAEFLFNDLNGWKAYVLHYNAVESLCLTHNGDYNGAALVLAQCDPDGSAGINQVWDWENMSPNVKPAGESVYSRPYRLRDFKNWDYCIDVYNAGSANGTRVQLWGCNNQPNQLFY